MLTIIADAMIRHSRPNKGWDAPDNWHAPTRLRRARDHKREEYQFRSKWNKHMGLW